MTASRIQQAVERLVSTGLATPCSIEGCTEDEIRALEGACGLALPPAYREFLRLAGRQAGTFLVGSDLGYETLIENQAGARDLAGGSGSQWPQDGFAFVLHQGYSGLMFRAGEGDDPPVYAISEEEPLRQVADTLTGWPEAAIEDEAGLGRNDD